MPNIEQEIRGWLHKQQDWLQGAVEILLVSASVADSDIKAVAERLKSADGQQLTNHRTFDGIGNTFSSTAEVRLLENSTWSESIHLFAYSISAKRRIW